MANLLEEASILLTPTAYDNGKMLAVKPSDNLYGLEEITNGDFANGSTDWTLGTGWSIGDSKVDAINAAFGSSFTQNMTVVPNRKYKVSFDVSDYVKGNFRIQIGNKSSSEISSNGSFTFFLTSINSSIVKIETRSGGSGTTLSIDNISVKEDLSGDFSFSRNSAATRVNAQGLVENVQILSSNLVSNGDFSQEGVQEVSNGSFSQEGAEQVTNGNFATDSDWTKETGWSISEGSAKSNGVAYSRIWQSSVLTSGKTYKLRFDITAYTSGQLEVYNNGQWEEAYDAVNSYEKYINANTTFLYFRAKSTSPFIGSIDNVSVKEVGQDWDLGSGWSIGEDKAVFDGGADSAIQQDGVAISGKKYKVSLDVNDMSSGSLQLRFGSSGSVDETITQNGSYTFYLLSDGTKAYFRSVSGFNGSITNISVKEVGQDWDLGTGWSIGEDKAVATNAINSNLQQTNITISNTKKYKINFTINDYTSGSVRPMLGAVGAVVGTFVSANGTYTEILTANNNFDRIVFRTGGSDFNATITNISVIEITDDTNLPRINYEGFSYQDSLGSEEIVNGTFDSDTTWIKNGQVTIGGGVAYFDSDGTFTQIAQSISGVSGKNVKVVIEITEYTQGTLKVLFSGGTQQNLPNSIGVHTLYFNNADSDTINIARLGGVTNLKIDNVSVKEYLGQEVVPDSGCGSWLLEPQSTNLVPYSEAFDNTYWTKSGASVVSGFTSPDGTANAYKMTEDSATSVHKISNNSAIGNSFQSQSIFVKYDSSQQFIQTTSSRSINNYVNFDILNKTLTNYGTSVGKIVELSSGWLRLEVYHDSSTTAYWHFITSLTASWSESYLGTGKHLLIFGAQVEAGSHATSYTPTQGAASTRLRDIATNSGNASLINSEEGTLYFELNKVNNHTSVRFIGISDNTAYTNRVQMVSFANSNLFRFEFVVGGSSLSINYTENENTFKKYAITYDINFIKLYVNGIKISQTANTIGLPLLNTFDRFNFSGGGGNNPFYGNTKALAVFKTALTDEQLTALTTI